ncbi:hypothetical protein Tco_0512666, partial [Tanacetum coccineum]
MVEATSSVPRAEVLEFPKKDNCRFLHMGYRVADLEQSVTPPNSGMQRNGNNGVLRQSTTIKI